jgi:hypothetical protein
VQLRDRLNRLEQGADQQKLDQFKGQYDRVRNELVQAAEEGDTAKQVELTEKIADMRAAARVADQARSQDLARVQQQQQQQPSPPQEQPPQEALTWWNKNRWFNSPEHKAESAYARSVDESLDAEGFDKDTPEYYAELDTRLQKKFPELYSDTTFKPSKPPIAPTGGSGGGTRSKRPNDGRLRFTKAELDMAKTLGITTEEGLRTYHAEIQKGDA